MLQLVLQMPQPASSKPLDKGQLVVISFETGFHWETSILVVRDHQLRAWHKRDTPLGAIERLNRKDLPTGEDNQDLSADNDQLEAHKPRVPGDTI